MAGNQPNKPASDGERPGRPLRCPHCGQMIDRAELARRQPPTCPNCGLVVPGSHDHGGRNRIA